MFLTLSLFFKTKCILTLSLFFLFQNTCSENTRLNEFPYLVNLWLGEGLGCLGTLISEDWVLTAGHCIKKRDHTKFQAFIGSIGTGLWEDMQGRFVSEAINHPKFRQDENLASYYDFSLLKLDRPVHLIPGSVEPIKRLVNEDWNLEKYDEFGIVLGWGSDGNGTDIILKEEQILLRLEECKQVYKLEEEGDDSLFCAVGNKQVDDNSTSIPCEGDSGSPLLCKDENGNLMHCGLVSFGIDCSSNFPVIFGKTSKVVNWIREITGI